ncbi:hypothetical protein GCM10011371_13090 [Novosphingobium marinum]|nr:hypothetical protein GCM10011371_13090 [Novosphingobium marinum]
MLHGAASTRTVVVQNRGGAAPEQPDLFTLHEHRASPLAPQRRRRLSRKAEPVPDGELNDDLADLGAKTELKGLPNGR